MAKNEIQIPPGLERKTAKPRQVKVVLTVDLKEGEDGSELRSYLAELGRVEDYEAASTESKPTTTHDAYGNPYDRSAAVNTACDAYGNPYDRSATAAPAQPDNVKRDAYGNPY